MEKMLKTGCILMVVFFVAITVGSVTEQGAYAGGGINYKVTVRNDTDSSCKVCIWYASANLIVNCQNKVTISKGGSYTFETGANCPCGLTGKYYWAEQNIWVKIQDTHILGHKVSSIDEFSPCCWSSSFRICRKVDPGTAYSEVRDNDFGFCKE